MSRKRRAKGRRKKRSNFPYLPILFLLIFLGSTILFVRYRDILFPPPTPRKAKPSIPAKIIPAPERGIHATIYFSNREGTSLVGEAVEIRKGGLEEMIEKVLEDLIRGPKGEKTGTIPPGTRLISVRIKGKVAYVDFSRELSEKHPGGSSAEVQTVYSIVNSIVFNFPQIERVQILIEGRRRETLAGHIDISMPLKGEKRLIAEES